MMKIIKILAMYAMLAVCMVACSKDEPAPPVEPDQTENPNDPGNQDDQGDSEDPNTQDNIDGNPEQWDGEKPHGFYFDVDDIELNMNEYGFLLFRGSGDDYQSVYDNIIMESKWKYPGYPEPENRTSQKHLGALRCPMSQTDMGVVGKRATPWNNVNRYKEFFQKVNIRPDSKFSDFPEFANLPLGNVQDVGMFVWDTLVNAQVVTHKYFNSKLPAGSTMPGFDDSAHPVYMCVTVICGTEIFKEMQHKPWKPSGPGPERIMGLGKIDTRYTSLVKTMYLQIYGYPEKAGNYPMTITLEFASGRKLSKDFKIRFVNERP